jgi:enediyne biosynthesis protein E4
LKPAKETRRQPRQPWNSSAALTLTNAQLTDAGAYHVAVSDSRGTNFSNDAVLDVDPTFTKITTDPLATDQAEWHVAACGDYNGDGFCDVYLHQVDGADYLYRNNGAGSFVQITDPSLRVPGKGAMGPAWDDYDNDGTLDLFLPNGVDPNQLLRNRGDGTFKPLTALPAGESRGSSGAGWGDFDRDGYLDLFVGNGGWAEVSYPNSFYRNRGDGTFTKLTSTQVGSWLNESQIFGLVGWVDYDDDGWPDLFAVPTLAPRPRLYRNLGNGAFVSITTNAICGDIGSWMGFAWSDYDNDGRLDLFGAMDGTCPNVLYHNEGAGNFRKMTLAEVGSIAGDTAFGAGAAWGDYDNDGFQDLFVPNGSWYLGHDGVQKSFFYHNNGNGTFTRINRGSPANEFGESWGAHWIDFNRDGFLDLFVSEYHAAGCCLPIANRLYINNRNTNSWLGVTCIGTSSPRSGTGAKVRVRATINGSAMWQIRLINSGATSYGGQSPTAHFGLGDATNVHVLRIEWPSGIIQELQNVAANQYLTVVEPTKLSMPKVGELHIQCWRGMIYRIDSSADLLSWKPLATVTNVAGSLQWTDPEAPGQAARFYRAAMMH